MKKNLLQKTISHIDVKKFDSMPIIKQFENMAYQSRNLNRAAKIYDLMIKDTNSTIILCLAGSLVSAGLKKVFYDLINCNMVDVVVSTGANIVDQDFFEALGYKHYIGNPQLDDDVLVKNHIDRIYDTLIDEMQLRVCDNTVEKIANSLAPRPFASWEFIYAMGEYLKKNKLGNDSLVGICYKKKVPIFVPAFSDSSAGFGLASHQNKRKNNNKVTIDSAKDFLDLTKIKLASKETGLVIIGGGVPKNFAQDITVAAEILKNQNIKMHKWAIQITVADERDGGLSGSTLKEAHSWGKVDIHYEQMVFSEATIALPLLASYVYHRKNWKKRISKKLILSIK